MESNTPDSEASEKTETGLEGVVSRKGISARLMGISRETAPLMNDGRTLKQLMDELYDEETGLPK